MATSRRPRAYEYRLLIAPHLNERLQKKTVVVSIETTRLFASFRYELSLREERSEKSFRYVILGLRAPQLDLPSSGSARSVREYELAAGRYQFEVVSLDGTVDSCEVLVGKDFTLSLKPKKSTFVEFVALS